MSSIYFEKGKAGVVNAPSRKRCYRCWWRSRKDEFLCAYALENNDTVLGNMRRLQLPDGAPCPCFLADKQVKVKSSIEKSVEEDVRFSAAKKSKKEREAEKRRADTERKRAAREKARMDLYNEGYSDQEIADKVGCARGTIVSWRGRNELPCHYNEAGRPVTEVAKALVANRK